MSESAVYLVQTLFLTIIGLSFRLRIFAQQYRHQANFTSTTLLLDRGHVKKVAPVFGLHFQEGVTITSGIILMTILKPLEWRFATFPTKKNAGAIPPLRIPYQSTNKTLCFFVFLCRCEGKRYTLISSPLASPLIVLFTDSPWRVPDEYRSKKKLRLGPDTQPQAAT